LESRNAYGILIGIYCIKRTARKVKKRSEDNVDIYLKKILFENVGHALAPEVLSTWILLPEIFL
jgi:hypothetical protein